MIAPVAGIGLLAGVDADGGEACARREASQRRCYHSPVSRRCCSLPTPVHASLTRVVARRRSCPPSAPAAAAGLTPPPARAPACTHLAGPPVPRRGRAQARRRRPAPRRRPCPAAIERAQQRRDDRPDRLGRRTSSWRLFVLMKRRLLWRVRRKLILSYIFIGVVPALLIIGSSCSAALVLSMNVSAYLFQDGYDDIVDDVELAAEAAAAEIARNPAAAGETIARVQRECQQRRPAVPRRLSLAFVADARRARRRIGPRRRRRGSTCRAPTGVPAWLTAAATGSSGTIALPAPDAPGEVAAGRRAPRSRSADDGASASSSSTCRSTTEIIRQPVRVAPASRRVDHASAANASAAAAVSTVDRPTAAAAAGHAVRPRASTFLDCHDWDDRRRAPRHASAISYRAARALRQLVGRAVGAGRRR